MKEDDINERSRTPGASSNGAFDIVALAASAGGLRALSQVLHDLPSLMFYVRVIEPSKTTLP